MNTQDQQPVIKTRKPRRTKEEIRQANEARQRAREAKQQVREAKQHAKKARQQAKQQAKQARKKASSTKKTKSIKCDIVVNEQHKPLVIEQTGITHDGKIYIDGDIFNDINKPKFDKILLSNNSKSPSFEWKDYHKKPKPTRPEIAGKNYGVPCGPCNDIIVVDIDIYKSKDEFKKQFGSIAETVERYNTYTVITPKGGLHLYFKHEPGFKNKPHGSYIDVKTHGGYVVGAGALVEYSQPFYKYSDVETKTTHVLNKISSGEYECINDINPVAMPDDIINYLASIDISRQTPRKPRDTIDNTEHEQQFKYDVDDIILKYILDNDDELRIKLTDYIQWLNFTICCHALNKYDMFYEYSKIAYGVKFTHAINEQNKQIYDNIKISQYDQAFIIFFTTADLKQMRYVDIKPNIIKPTKHITTGRYVQDMSKRSIYDNEFKNNFVMSDTGTGKTASFINYVKTAPDINFLSITLRTSLCDDQYNSMTAHGIDVKNYQIQKNFLDGDNIICQLDSIITINTRKIDISKYTLFLDETDGLLSYLTTSPTMKSTLCHVFKKILYLLKHCKKVICCDKLMSDTAIRFINHATSETNYEFYKNTFKNWCGVVVNVWDSEEAIIDDIKILVNDGSGFVCGVDERRVQQLLNNEVNKQGNITMISKTTRNIDLTNDKMIFTPKITEGVDIQPIKPIPTYGIYNTTTINARSMYQQLTRNRKPTNINLCFLSNRCMKCPDITDDDIYNKLDELNAGITNQFNDMATDDETKLFFSLMSHYIYNDRAYKSNPKKHILKMMHEAGFIVNNTINDATTNMMTSKQRTELNRQTMKGAMLKPDLYQHPEFTRVNEILKLPIEVAIYNAKLYTCVATLARHFNICKFKNNDANELINSIDKRDTFKLHKLQCKDNEIATLKRIIDIAGCDKDLTNINKLSSSDYNKINSLIHTTLTVDEQAKTHVINNNLMLRCYISRRYKMLFGPDSLIKCGVHRIRTMKDGKKTVNKKFVLYQYDDDFLKNVDFIESFRKQTNTTDE
jgi:hypothetical protein